MRRAAPHTPRGSTNIGLDAEKRLRRLIQQSNTTIGAGSRVLASNRENCEGRPSGIVVADARDGEELELELRISKLHRFYFGPQTICASILEN